MKDSIVLQGGIEIKDCQNKLTEFCEKDASYRGYDLQKVQEDNELTMEDIKLANRMGARMGSLVIQSVVGRAKTINSALEHIAPGTSISDKSVPWLAIKQLFSATLGPEIGPARVTKILHKKRPALIPILDSVVLSYCKAIYTDELQGDDEAPKMTSYVKVYKVDVDTNIDVLENIIKVTALKLTLVRALDILLWGYSGEYEKNFGKPPVWKR